MDTKDHQAVDAKAVVMAEFESLLQRCEAAGVPRDVARRELHFKLTYDSVTSWAEEDKARREAASQTPAGKALQKACELYFLNEEIQRARVTPDRTEFNAVCLEYLRLAHNAAPGDTLEIHAWAKPRTVRVQAFTLSFRDAEYPTDAMMWFEGEGVRNCPKGRNISDHGAPLDARIYKV